MREIVSSVSGTRSTLDHTKITDSMVSFANRAMDFIAPFSRFAGDESQLHDRSNQAILRRDTIYHPWKSSLAEMSLGFEFIGSEYAGTKNNKYIPLEYKNDYLRGYKFPILNSIKSGKLVTKIFGINNQNNTYHQSVHFRILQESLKMGIISEEEILSAIRELSVDIVRSFYQKILIDGHEDISIKRDVPLVSDTDKLEITSDHLNILRNYSFFNNPFTDRKSINRNSVKLYIPLYNQQLIDAIFDFLTQEPEPAKEKTRIMIDNYIHGNFMI